MDPQIWLLLGGVVLFAAFTFWQQRQARKQRQQQVEALKVGDDVLTIGGIIGRLVYLDQAENRARIEIAGGVEMEVLLSAIRSPLAPADEPAGESGTAAE